ncbi:hypothetical protein INR49_023224 [Caranx melampygus]|nr:hypothetical protein INR49_023224 [Caranx melampygus]
MQRVIRDSGGPGSSPNMSQCEDKGGGGGGGGGGEGDAPPPEDQENQSEAHSPELKRPVSPSPSSVSMRSDRSKDLPPVFKEGAPSSQVNQETPETSTGPQKPLDSVFLEHRLQFFHGSSPNMSQCEDKGGGGGEGDAPPPEDQENQSEAHRVNQETPETSTGPQNPLDSVFLYVSKYQEFNFDMNRLTDRNTESKVTGPPDTLGPAQRTDWFET